MEKKGGRSSCGWGKTVGGERNPGEAGTWVCVVVPSGVVPSGVATALFAVNARLKPVTPSGYGSPSQRLSTGEEPGPLTFA